MSIYMIAQLTGRCANGAQRDGGKKTHAVPSGETWSKALCGATPGRLTSGWHELDGPEVPSCPRCMAKAWAISLRLAEAK